MYLSIGEKARECAVSVATLRRWDKRGLLKPDIITVVVIVAINRKIFQV